MMSTTGMIEKWEEATFGGGCFWCVEAVFQELKGMKEVYPGFSGGHVKNPAYREVCNETTGHAEVVRIIFNSDEITYSELLRVFFRSHDPTTPNRQGADKGTQYRSVIFYHDENQRVIAQKAKEAADGSDLFENQVVTEIDPLKNFYRADDNHHNYYLNNPDAPYCQAVIKPKLEKFREKFDGLRKNELKK